MPSWINDAAKALTATAKETTTSALKAMADALPENLKQQFTDKAMELTNALFQKPENKPGTTPKIEEENNKPQKKSLLELLLELLKLLMNSSMQFSMNTQNSVNQFSAVREAVYTVCSAVSNQLKTDLDKSQKATNDAYQQLIAALGTGKPIDPGSVSPDAFKALGLNPDDLVGKSQSKQTDSVIAAYGKQHDKDYADYKGNHTKLWDTYTQTQDQLGQIAGLPPKNAAAQKDNKDDAANTTHKLLAPLPPQPQPDNKDIDNKEASKSTTPQPFAAPKTTPTPE